MESVEHDNCDQRIPLQVSGWLKAKLQDAAQRDRRSLNSFIRITLEDELLRQDELLRRTENGAV